MDIVDKIRELQGERDWTDYKLAQEAETTYSTISTMYQRKTPPKIELLQRICKAFGLTLSQFFLEDEQIEVLSENEKEMLFCFRRLSPEKQRALIELIYR